MKSCLPGKEADPIPSGDKDKSDNKVDTTLKRTRNIDLLK